MAVALKISDELVNKARPVAAANERSITKQIEYWAKLGKAAEDNPELTIDFIKQIFIGIEEVKAGETADYQPRPRSMARG